MKEYFKDGATPRLELCMLPRDTSRVTGMLRKTLVSAFNYCRQYPVKLELFIEITKFAVNYALLYKHFVEERLDEAEKARIKKVEDEVKETERLATEERLAMQEAEEAKEVGNE